MLILYDVNHNKIAALKNVKEPKRERELSGDEVLSFLYPILDPKYTLIKEECYVRTKDNEYVIKEINEDDDWTEFVAKVNVETLKGKEVDHFETVEQTCTNTINLAIASTGWTIGSCDVTKKRTVRKKRCSSYDILQEIRNVYKCDFKFDAINKKIYIYQSRGTDKGAYFTDQLNLKKLDVQSNTYDYITRIIALGKDGLTIESVNGGIKYLENYQYSNKVITAYWEDNRYTVAQNLKEDAALRLNELSKPRRAYKADIIDLAKSSDGKYSALDYDLGDTITLTDNTKKVRDKQRIVKVIEYLDEPEKNQIEIANRVMSLEDLQVRLENSADVVESITTSDRMIDNSKVDFDPIRLEVVNIISQKADIADLNAATARIGSLETNKMNADEAYLKFTQIDEALLGKATIGDLTAINTRVVTIEGKTSNFETMLSKEVFTELATVGQIVAGSSIIAEGSIGDAQISSLSAVKITSGTVDTSKVTIQGANGRLKITGNRLQVFAGTTNLYERVSVGDVNGDGSVYGLRIRGADGVTVLLDETGVKREGITDGSINNEKIAGDANISGTKLDIASVVTSINNGTTTIQGSKVYVDGKTLDVSFSTLKTTVTDQGTSISSINSQITTINNEISLRVKTQDFSSYKTTNDSAVNDISTRLNSTESSISVLQGQIVSKVTQTEIDNAVNPLNTRISTAESTITQNTADINLRVHTSTYTAKMSDLDNSISSLGSRVSSAELKITDSAIVSTVRSSTAYTNDLASKEGSITKGTTAPPSPAPNQLWLDTSVTPNQLKRWTGSEWVKATPSAANEVGAYSAGDGSALAGRMTTAESNILQQAGEIALKVSKDGIVSAINQTAETIKISASKINLDGYVTFTSLSTPGATSINGSNISSGTITGALLKTSSTTSYLHLQQQYIDIFDSGNKVMSLGYALNGSYKLPYLKMTYGEASSWAMAIVAGMDASGVLHSDIQWFEKGVAFYNGAYVEDNLKMAAVNGNGLRFWDSDTYKIYMSAAGDTTWGGRISGETTSDYNMYFRMASGTNRGFVFLNNRTPIATINPAYMRFAPSSNQIYFGSGNCRFDVASGIFRVQADAGNYVAISTTDIAFIFGGSQKHIFRADGTKTAGSIEIEGINYGMSPVDSPRVLILDPLYDVAVEETGTIVVLNPILAKSLNGYAVFPSNGLARITNKTKNTFIVEGYTGIIDLMIIGNRINSTDIYFMQM